MALPRTSSGGDNTPLLKYDAKSGRFFASDRFQNEEGKWESRETEIRDLEALFDFGTLEVGYGAFPGKKPDFRLMMYSDYQKTGQFPARPPEYHEEGKVKWYSMMAQVGLVLKDGSVRRFAQLSSVGYAAIADLLDAYEAAPESKEGKMPVVKCDGVEAIKSKHGTNYKPKLVIDRWADKTIDPDDYAPQSATPVAVASGLPQDDEDGALPF